MTTSQTKAESMTETRVEAALHRAEFQSVVFADTPKRARLMRAAAAMPTQGPPIKLRVHRNHPFEFIATLLPSFCGYAGRNIEVSISDYDDSLHFSLEESADAELIWLDFTRYKLPLNELSEWLKNQTTLLRRGSLAPILIAAHPDATNHASTFNASITQWAKDIPAVRILPLNEIAEDLGEDYFDKRMSDVGATKLSERANVTLARKLGLCWLPSVLEPRLKAVVFDLDNTLWGGVLGEDGPDGVVIDQGYATLQEKAVDLADSGLFIGVLSRNEDADVAAMFASGRMQLPLEKVTDRSVSWGHKADGMAKIATKLRIGFDSILFVDDNPGELAAVASACPGIKLLHAAPDPLETRAALKYFPGLFSWGVDETDLLRSTDLATNDARQELRSTTKSEVDYLSSLQLEMRVAVDPAAHQERLFQLSQKTNQFNTALKRLSTPDVAEVLERPDKHAVAVWLTDRFSDSGLIAAMFVSVNKAGKLSVDELCVSCRALGRGIEDAMVVAAINAVSETRTQAGEKPIRSVTFALQEGPRNGPALTWLEKFSGQSLATKTSVELSRTDTSHFDKTRTLPIRFLKGEPDETR